MQIGALEGNLGLITEKVGKNVVFREGNLLSQQLKLKNDYLEQFLMEDAVPPTGITKERYFAVKTAKGSNDDILCFQMKRKQLDDVIAKLS